MEAKFQRPNGRDGALFSLNAAIDALDLARDAASVKPAKDVFGSTSTLLARIRDSVIDNPDCVELGLTCADVCKALHHGENVRRAGRPSRSVLEAVGSLATAVTEIQSYIVKRGKRHAFSRYYHAKDDEKAISAWTLNLDEIRQVFEADLARNTDTSVPNANLRRDASDTHNSVPILGVSDSGISVPGDRHDLQNTRTVILNAHDDAALTEPVVSRPANDPAETPTDQAASKIPHRTPRNHKDTNPQTRAAYASAPGESPPTPQSAAPADSRFDIKTHSIVSELQRGFAEIHRILQSRDDIDSQSRAIQNIAPSELSSPPPRVFFGRNELIDKIVSFANLLTPVALIGPGGTGKTSIALTALHDDRIKQRFGEERQFIRCDQFPALLPHFLRRLSKAVGLGVENLKDLTPLQPLLSSRPLFLVLDNAEFILDPRGPNAGEIYSTIDELSQLRNVCICITSRIHTVPPRCEILEIPKLSTEAVHDALYRTYMYEEPLDLGQRIAENLDFRLLQIPMLASVTYQNKQGVDHLMREWERRRTGTLQTEHNENLASTIGLPLVSPNSGELLGVLTLFPQCVDEKNFDSLFSTISGKAGLPRQSKKDTHDTTKEQDLSLIDGPQSRMTDEGTEKMGAEDLDTAFAQAAASYQAESARIEEGLDIMGTLANSTGDTNTKQITSTPENDEIAKWEAEFTMLMEQQASSFQPDIPEQWDGPVGFSGDGVPSFGDYVFEEDNQFLTEISGTKLLERAKILLNQDGSLSEAALMLEAAIQRGESGEGGYEAWILLGEALNMDEREGTGIVALTEGVRRAEEAGANGAGMLALAASYTNESYDRASHLMLLRWLQAAHPDAEIPETASSSLKDPSWYARQQVTQAFLDYARVQHSKDIVDADLQTGLGILFYTSGDYDRAKDCFEAALSVRPTDYRLWNRLGSSLSTGGKNEESLDAYRMALSLRPTYVRAIHNVAVACLNIGAHKEAAEHIISALSLRSASCGGGEYLWSILRRVMLTMGRDDLAEIIGDGGRDLEVFRNHGFDF